MKIQLLSIVLAILFAATTSAQNGLKSENIPVSGNCSMCQNNIEKAAKAGGASEAGWNRQTKMLTVKFDPKATNVTSIQQIIADAGYDTRDIRASDSAYNDLHSCCKYERTKTYKKTTKNKGGDDDADCCKDKASTNQSDKKTQCGNATEKEDCCK